MTRIIKILVAVVALGILALAFAGSTQASFEPQTVRVTLTDYNVGLSQFAVAPGKSVQFLVANDGTLAHKVVIQPFAGADVTAMDQAPVIAPGTTRMIQGTFGPGVYRIQCAQWDHTERGMVNVFAVDKVNGGPMPWQWPMQLAIPLLSLVLGVVVIIGDSLGLRLTRAR